MTMFGAHFYLIYAEKKSQNLFLSSAIQKARDPWAGPKHEKKARPKIISCRGGTA